jgi:cardiolipin synthase (CMP-forming)
MGLANWLTVLRIILVPVFVLLLVYKRPGFALVVFGLAALTDLLDGYVARRRGIQSRLGAFLDPMADKLLLTVSFVALTQLKILPAWITIVVLSRDVILMMGALLIHMLGGRIYPRPSWAGKAATFFQILTVLAGMLVRYFRTPTGAPSVVLSSIVWLAAIFTIFSGLQYLVQGMRYLSATDAAREESSESVFFR